MADPKKLSQLDPLPSALQAGDEIYVIRSGVSYRAPAEDLLLKVGVPASATAPGTTNEWAEDGDYFYLCVATDTWRRFPLAEW